MSLDAGTLRMIDTLVNTILIVGLYWWQHRHHNGA